MNDLSNNPGYFERTKSMFRDLINLQIKMKDTLNLSHISLKI